MTEWREYQCDSEYTRSRRLDPSQQTGVSEMAEHYEKVRCDVCGLACRPGIGWRVPSTCLTRPLRNVPSEFCFASLPALSSSQFLDLLD